MSQLRILLWSYVCIALGCIGCSTTPTYRPPIPLSEGRRLEVGLGAQGAATSLAAGPGMAAWALYRAQFDDVELDFFASGHGTQLWRFSSQQLTGPFAGASAGLRTRMAFLPELRFAAEASLDYLEDQRRAATLRHISGIVRLPVAQRVIDGIWVYAAPTFGISIPLYERPELPFFGIQEMPLGISWTPHPDFSLVAEGGMWGGSFSTLADVGGYGGVALMFHPR